MRNWIISCLPPHSVYTEAFGGSMAVALGLPDSDGMKYRKVLNDLDSNVPNLFRVLRDHNREFKRKVLLTPYSRDEFNTAYDTLNSPDKTYKNDIVEWARLYLVLNRQSIFGKEAKSWCVSREGENICSTWEHLGKLISELRVKLRNCYIENADYTDFLARWDCNNACHYLDPPYEGVEQKYYAVNKEHVFSHEILANTVLGLKGKAVISYYDSDNIRYLYRGCRFETKQVKMSMTTSAKQEVSELLIIKDW